MKRTKGEIRCARQRAKKKKAQRRQQQQNAEWATANVQARRESGSLELVPDPPPLSPEQVEPDPEQLEDIGWGPGKVRPRDVVRILQLARKDGETVLSEDEVVQLLRGVVPLGASAIINRQHRNYATIMRSLVEAAKLQESKQPQVGVVANDDASVQVKIYLPEKQPLDES